MGRKISVVLDDDLFKEVEEFRKKNPQENGSIHNRTWAIETLLKKGLARTQEEERIERG